MLAALSPIFGYITGFAKKTIDKYQDNKAKQKEREQDIELARIQADSNKAVATAQMIEKTTIGAQKHSIALDKELSGPLGNVINLLRSSVRPVLTYTFVGFYIFFALYISFKYIQFLALSGIPTSYEEVLILKEIIISDFFMGILGQILGFWFGSR